MSLTLRPYQKRATAEVLNRASIKVRPIVVSPGGSGKTPVIAEITRMYLLEGKRVLIISHRVEILKQLLAHVQLANGKDLQVGIISAQMGVHLENPEALVQIASKDTLALRIELPDADVVIVDECHHVLAKGYRALLDRYKGAIHIGLTATPIRYDGLGLREWYNDLIVAALPSELIEQGFLATPRVFTTLDTYLPDLRNISVLHGEYSTRQLANEVMRDGLAGGVVDNYVRHANGKTFVGFSVTIPHSRQLTHAFNARGIPTAHVDGKTKDEQREKLLDSLREGRLKGIFNCALLSEGWDFPGCEAVIFARPTRSLTLFLQQASRGMRPMPDKKPIILDHARNAVTFGLPHADRYFSLDGSAATTIPVSPVKVCRHCQAVVERAVQVCPECGEPFGREVTLPGESAADLEELTKKTILDFRAKLQAAATARGWENDWVEAVMERWLSTRGLA